jgi:predicted permease
MLQDLRYAARTLLRSRGLTLAAVASLGLGIGANTTIFAWMKATVLQPLPGVEAPDRVVVVASRNAAGRPQSLSYPDYLDIRAKSRTLDDLIVQDLTAMNVRLESQRDAQRIFGMIVSGNYFEMLGVRAAHGRVFTAADDVTPDAHPVAVMSHAVWRARFHGDPSIVGRTLVINARAFTLLGIAPPGFNGTFMGLGMGLWIPMAMQKTIVPGADRLTSRGIRWLLALGRLKPGMSVEDANAELVTLARQLEQSYPQSNARRGAAAIPLWRSPWGSPQFMRPVMGVLGALVTLVLVIACANVANLLLARAFGRRREVAIRLSLGASRARLVRQLLVESVLLALLAGAAGVLIARWSAHLLSAFIPPMDIPIILDLAIDRAALLYAFAVSLVTGIAFGLAPALQASRPDVVSTLKGTSAAAGGGGSRLRGALVIAQLAMCVVLLVAAALFLRSLNRAQKMDPGFTARQLVFAGFDLFPNGYTGETGNAFMRRLIERVETLPGVEAAAVVRRPPLSPQGNPTLQVRVDGYSPAPEEGMDVEYNVVHPGYFRTMGIPLLRGRDVEWRDDARRREVAIVNEAMARRYWGTVDVVGRVFVAGKPLEIVGVVATGKYVSLNEAPQPHIYMPFQQAYRPDAALVVRYRTAPVAILSQVRAIARELDPNLPLVDVKTLDEHLMFVSFPQRIASTLLAVTGAVALLIAIVGLYAVVAYSVSQRTREIGVRVALGATPAAIRKAVLTDGFRLTSIGVCTGLVLAFISMRFASALLNGVSPADPLIFGLVAAGLTAVSLAAAFVPARRASRVDAIVALRTD